MLKHIILTYLQIDCNSATTCGGHGNCSATGYCVCDYAFSGPDCRTCTFTGTFPNCNGKFYFLYYLLLLTNCYYKDVIPSQHWTWLGGRTETVSFYPDRVGKSGGWPGGRESFAWTSLGDTLYLFGSGIVNSISNVCQVFNYIITERSGTLLNDLWAFNVSTGNWTWIAGSSTPSQPGIYTGATAGPGGRWGSTMWATATGYIYLFGGYGYGISAASGIFSYNHWQLDLIVLYY